MIMTILIMLQMEKTVLIYLTILYKPYPNIVDVINEEYYDVNDHGCFRRYIATVFYFSQFDLFSLVIVRFDLLRDALGAA